MITNSKALAQRNKIIKGLELSYQKLIEFKKMKNSPLIVSKDGKIVELSAEKADPKVKYELG